MLGLEPNPNPNPNQERLTRAEEERALRGVQHHLLVREQRDEQVRRLGRLPAQGLEERRERHRQPERVRGEPLELKPTLAWLG